MDQVADAEAHMATRCGSRFWCWCMGGSPGTRWSQSDESAGAWRQDLATYPDFMTQVSERSESLLPHDSVCSPITVQQQAGSPFHP